MGTVTAVMLIGDAHPNHGGIDPHWALYLSENSRPAWTLVPAGWVEGPQGGAGPGGRTRRVVWIPTVEHMLEDGLLLAYRHALRDERVCALADRGFRSESSGRAELYTDIELSRLEELHRACRESPLRFKVLLTVLAGSTVAGQLRALKGYDIDAEVCTTVWSRGFDPWAGQVRTEGALP